jgi:hypothetical protein
MNINQKLTGHITLQPSGNIFSIISDGSDIKVTDNLLAGSTGTTDYILRFGWVKTYFKK